VLPPNEQTVLVTGATDGIGREVATRLAQLGATVLLHGRDADRLEATRRDIAERTGATDVVPLQADLASLAEVDALADAVERHTDRLHLLLSNAGVGFGPPNGPREESRDGYELRFAVNHLAPYHLARRLAPLMKASAPSRIVQVVSAGQAPLDPDDLLTEHGWDGVLAYRRAKLAQVMAAFDLADDLRGSGVVVHALHPATLMDTTMVRDAEEEPESTVETGITAVVRLALDPTLDEVTGRFFAGPREAADAVHPQVHDPEIRAMLRRRSDELVRDALTRARGSGPAPTDDGTSRELAGLG
jgi:NAD(P)-dependent dehydrogenase (short-subunit alcohol dehydrogenase family)